MFAPSFFDQLEDRLNLAVYDTNQEYRMGILDLRKALGILPDTVPISVQDKGDVSVYTIGDKQITAPSVTPTADIAANYLNSLNPFGEEKTMSAPAPGSFAASIKAMMDEARAGVAKAREDGIAMVGGAVGKLKEAEAATVKVAGSMAKTIEDEAASVMSELGQISNDLGV